MAAGGVVCNVNDELLMIYKNKKWDLPKGKIDFGESALDAAISEVQEETGVFSLNASSNAFSTYHMYSDSLNSRFFFLKETKWFLMSATSKSILVPQSTEGILDVRWVKFTSFEQLTTYNSIKFLLKNMKGVKF